MSGLFRRASPAPGGDRSAPQTAPDGDGLEEVGSLGRVRRDETAFARYMLHRVPQVEGIRSLRTHRVTHMVADARRWRLRELDRVEVSRLERALPVARVDRAHVPPSVEADLLRLLSTDGRMSVTEIARQLGLTTARASHMVTTVLARRRIVVRTELARRLSGWPVYACFLRSACSQPTRAIIARWAGAERLSCLAGHYWSPERCLRSWGSIVTLIR